MSYWVHYADEQFDGVPWPGERRAGFSTQEDAQAQADHDAEFNNLIVVGVFSDEESEARRNGVT
jgi:hypothetical protein